MNPVKLTVESKPTGIFGVDHQRSLILLHPLDREKQEEYALIIKAVSAIDKAIPVGSVVITVKATDADTGLNAKIRYEILSGNTEGLFEMEPMSGMLKVQKALDSNIQSDYRLAVRGYDGGNPPLDDFTRIRIHIHSGESCRLFFPGSAYISKVYENNPPGTPLFTAKVVQCKNAKNISINYSISVPQDDGEFVINSLSGEVRTGKMFDYERKQFYAFTVYAKGDGGQQASMPCRVIVKAVDEFAPCFSSSSYLFQIPYDISPGSAIGSVDAQDQDFGNDGKIKYIFKEESPFFTIDSLTGMIYVNQSLTELYLKRSITPQIENSQIPEAVSVILTVTAYSESELGGVKENSTTIQLM
ncbi:unnamed protein product, partial [Soboliphyme baturini]|uniref:Cadherin domain-containing protein n=1 Tax=Soboliphyme baturini TaxID=241478 RepID=A0A183IT24_9BILA